MRYLSQPAEPELLLLPVSENGRPPYWNSTSRLDFDLSSLSACNFVSAHQISSKSVDTRWSYDVISIFQDDGSRIGNLLPASVLMTALV